MKLSAVTAIAATAVVVSATPLRVIVVSSGPAIQKVDASADEGPLAHVRMGRPVNAAKIFVPEENNGAPVAHRRPCSGGAGRFKQKTLDIANKFRAAFGFPPIQFDGHDRLHQDKTAHGGLVHILPVNHGEGTFVNVEEGGEHTTDGGRKGWWGQTKGGDRVEIVNPGPPPHHGGDHGPPPPHHHNKHHHHDGPHDGPPPPHHRHMKHHRHRGASFIVRLQTAVMALGPWEGRAVAFVIGAGLGVLLRMLWVLSVVAYRGFSGGNSGYAAVAEDEDEDNDNNNDEGLRRGTPLSAPPVYVYPTDEKAVYEVVEETEVVKTAPN